MTKTIVNYELFRTSKDIDFAGGAALATEHLLPQKNQSRAAVKSLMRKGLDQPKPLTLLDNNANDRLSVPGRGDGAQAAGQEGTSSGRPRPHSGRAPGPGQGACSGPLHPPPPRLNKRGREGLKAALCLPKPDSPAGSPLGARKQEKASSAQGTGAAAGGEDGRPGAGPRQTLPWAGPAAQKGPLCHPRGGQVRRPGPRARHPRPQTLCTWGHPTSPLPLHPQPCLQFAAGHKNQSWPERTSTLALVSEMPRPRGRAPVEQPRMCGNPNPGYFWGSSLEQHQGFAQEQSQMRHASLGLSEPPKEGRRKRILVLVYPPSSPRIPKVHPLCRDVLGASCHDTSKEEERIPVDKSRVEKGILEEKLKDKIFEM
eukprot:bmy_17127T0